MALKIKLKINHLPYYKAGEVLEVKICDCVICKSRKITCYVPLQHEFILFEEKDCMLLTNKRPVINWL